MVFMDSHQPPGSQIRSIRRRRVICAVTLIILAIALAGVFFLRPARISPQRMVENLQTDGWSIEVKGWGLEGLPAATQETLRHFLFDVHGITIEGSYRPGSQKIRVKKSDLRWIARQEKVDEIVVIRTDLTDDGVSYLTALPGLRRLVIAETPITDRSISEFRKKRSLKRLVLFGTLVTESAVAELQESRPDMVISYGKTFGFLDLPARLRRRVGE